MKFSSEDCGPGNLQSSEVVDPLSGQTIHPHTGQKFRVQQHFMFDREVDSPAQADIRIVALSLGNMRLKHEMFPVCGKTTSFEVRLTEVKLADVTSWAL